MTNTNMNTGCKLYQDFVNKIFGINKIIKDGKDNNVIGTLKYDNDFTEFKKNFESRLRRLKDKYENTPSYDDLLNTVAQVADEKNWEGAYAELVAYDIMSDGKFSDVVVELNKTLSVDESFAGEMGGKETNEDGFIYEYNLYFDVKILSDTVGDILKGIIDEAIKKSDNGSNCHILPEYQLDDDESDYQTNRRGLMEELKEYITTNKPKSGLGQCCFKSKILNKLSYRINWGGGVLSSEGTYDAYRHAEECKHLVFKRYTKKLMKNNPFFLILVNFPWYNSKINSFNDADKVFYRSLARRTFCEYKNLNTLMSSIVPEYNGPETVYEVSNYLSGIIFIDDHSIESDDYTCHVFLNPNSKNKLGSGISYLEQIVANGDNRSFFDDMAHDNY